MKLGCAAMICSFGVLSFALTAIGGDFTYAIYGDTITVTGYTGTGTDVTIPSHIQGLPVTAVASSAFSWNARLTSISIPDTVVDLGGSYAFAGCSNLTSMRIPDSVTVIWDQEFLWCTGLTNVVIGNGVTRIDYAAFAGCTNLKNAAIGANVTSLGTYAFYNCASLTTIAVPNLVQAVPQWVFGDCHALTNITLGPSVRALGNCCFAYCGSLENIVIPNMVTNMGVDTFAGCTRLSALYFWGDAPPLGDSDNLFINVPQSQPTIYYVPGTAGWSSTFADRPTAPWLLPYPIILSSAANFGIQSNGFGFIISWATNSQVAIDAATRLDSPTWMPVSTNALTGGTNYFTDPAWKQHAARFYRIRAL
jgi:hypothetical protein